LMRLIICALPVVYLAAPKLNALKLRL